MRVFGRRLALAWIFILPMATGFSPCRADPSLNNWQKNFDRQPCLSSTFGTASKLGIQQGGQKTATANKSPLDEPKKDASWDKRITRWAKPLSQDFNAETVTSSEYTRVGDQPILVKTLVTVTRQNNRKSTNTTSNDKQAVDSTMVVDLDHPRVFDTRDVKPPKRDEEVWTDEKIEQHESKRRLAKPHRIKNGIALQVDAKVRGSRPYLEPEGPHFRAEYRRPYWAIGSVTQGKRHLVRLARRVQVLIEYLKHPESMFTFDTAEQRILKVIEQGLIKTDDGTPIRPEDISTLTNQSQLLSWEPAAVQERAERELREESPTLAPVNPTRAGVETMIPEVDLKLSSPDGQLPSTDTPSPARSTHSHFSGGSQASRGGSADIYILNATVKGREVRLVFKVRSLAPYTSKEARPAILEAINTYLRKLVEYYELSRAQASKRLEKVKIELKLLEELYGEFITHAIASFQLDFIKEQIFDQLLPHYVMKDAETGEILRDPQGNPIQVVEALRFLHINHGISVSEFIDGLDHLDIPQRYMNKAHSAAVRTQLHRQIRGFLNDNPGFVHLSRAEQSRAVTAIAHGIQTRGDTVAAVAAEMDRALETYLPKATRDDDRLIARLSVRETQTAGAEQDLRAVGMAAPFDTNVGNLRFHIQGLKHLSATELQTLASAKVTRNTKINLIQYLLRVKIIDK